MPRLRARISRHMTFTVRISRPRRLSVAQVRAAADPPSLKAPISKGLCFGITKLAIHLIETTLSLYSIALGALDTGRVLKVSGKSFLEVIVKCEGC